MNEAWSLLCHPDSSLAHGEADQGLLTWHMWAGAFSLKFRFSHGRCEVGRHPDSVPKASVSSLRTAGALGGVERGWLSLLQTFVLRPMRPSLRKP